MIDRFSTTGGGAALVLNPTAGGVGLNIQAARHVIHYTLEWNSARGLRLPRVLGDVDRNPRAVHRLFYANTIDELILDKLIRKQELFDEVVQPTEEAGASLRQLLDGH